MNEKILLDAIGQINDEYIIESASKRKTGLKAPMKIFIAACLCLMLTAVLQFSGLFADKNASRNPEEPLGDSDKSVSGFVNTEQEGNTEFEQAPVEATKKSDGSGMKDAVDTVFVYIKNGIYRQLEEEEYELYGLKKSLYAEDLGKKVGEITRINKETIGKWYDSPHSKEKKLGGCEVYRYKPTDCDALIIVKGEGICSAFIFTGFLSEGHGVDEIYAVFSAETSENIESISYDARSLDSKKLGSGVVADKEKIKDFFDISVSLVPFVIHDKHIGTPDWLNEARENYFDNADKVIFVSIKVNFTNGLFYEMSYQPNLGTGYFEGGYEFLSPEDNEKLKGILS